MSFHHVFCSLVVNSPVIFFRTVDDAHAMNESLTNIQWLNRMKSGSTRIQKDKSKDLRKTISRQQIQKV